jgi:hypothetical protein
MAPVLSGHDRRAAAGTAIYFEAPRLRLVIWKADLVIARMLFGGAKGGANNKSKMAPM